MVVTDKLCRVVPVMSNRVSEHIVELVYFAILLGWGQKGCKKPTLDESICHHGPHNESSFPPILRCGFTVLLGWIRDHIGKPDIPQRVARRKSIDDLDVIGC